MAWAREFLVVLPACPPPVSAVPLSARAGLPRGEAARESSVPVITAVLHRLCYSSVCSRSVSLVLRDCPCRAVSSPIGHSVRLRLGLTWFEHVIPALEPIARAFCVSGGYVLPVTVVAPECYVWSGCFFTTRFVQFLLVFVDSLLSPFCNNARLLLYECGCSGVALCPWWLQLRTSFASCS